MNKYVDMLGWQVTQEISDTCPEVIVEGISFDSEVTIRIAKNQWGVPVYRINPYINDPSEVPAGYLVKARNGSIPKLPANFGAWVSRIQFESSGPFMKGHCYRMQSGPYARIFGKWPAHIKRLILQFEGILDGMDEFLVLEDNSLCVDTDPSKAPPMKNLTGSRIGYEHQSPQEVLNQRDKHPCEPTFTYLGPQREA